MAERFRNSEGRLTDGSISSNEVIGEAIMTLLSAMTELEASVQRHFTKNVVNIIFVLSLGYAWEGTSYATLMSRSTSMTG